MDGRHIWEYKDIVVEGKHAEMLRILQENKVGNSIDIFISALQAGIVSNRQSKRIVNSNEQRYIPRTLFLSRSQVINIVVEASVMFLVDGCDVNEKFNTYLKNAENNEWLKEYDEKLIEFMLGGIEILYETTINAKIE